MESKFISDSLIVEVLQIDLYTNQMSHDLLQPQSRDYESQQMIIKLM